MTDLMPDDTGGEESIPADLAREPDHLVAEPLLDSGVSDGADSEIAPEDLSEAGADRAVEPDSARSPEAPDASLAEPGDGALGDAGQRAETGDVRVDAAVADLDSLGGLPVSEHPGVFERIHGKLVEVLGELRQGGTEPGQGRQAD